MAKREMKTAKTEETIIEPVVPEVEEKVENVKAVIGVVTDCSKLNVRKKANLKANVVSILDAKTEVTVCPDESTKEWYKITVDGVEGYCMKKYISVKQ